MQQQHPAQRPQTETQDTTTGTTGTARTMTNSQRRTANDVASGHSGGGVGRVVRGDCPGGGDADMTTVR
jgi:hypothetical protein